MCPSRGSQETALWRVQILPNTSPTPHALTREELFYVVAGEARVEIAGEQHSAKAGDVIVIPRDTRFSLDNAGAGLLELLCCFPVGGQAKLDGKNKDLQKQVEDLQAKAAMLSQAELMRRQEALGIKYQEVQQLYMELQEDISNSETMLVEKIYKNAQTVVDTIAKDEGIEVVLVKSPMSILYANPKIDITNRVIVAYDKKFK